MVSAFQRAFASESSFFLLPNRSKARRIGEAPIFCLHVVIQPHTGAKVDLVPLSRDIHTRAAFARRQRIVYDEVTGRAAYFATAEDMIVAKLNAYQETGSEKHLRDARGMVVTQWGRLNLGDVTRWARAAGVEETWLALLEAIGGE